MNQYKLFDGRKAISISSFGEEAWQTIQAERSRLKLIPLLKRCFELRCNSVSSTPYKITTLDNEELYSSGNALPPSLLWLKDFRRLLYQIQYSLLRFGQAFVYASTDEFRLLTASTMTPIYDTDFGIIRYERNLIGSTVDFDLDEIIYIFYPSEHELMYAKSAYDVSLNAVFVTDAMQTFYRNYFDRGAIKATILTVEGTPSANERERLKSLWSRVVSGVKNSWNTEVLASKITPVVVGEGLESLQNINLTIEQRQEILFAFNVPESLVMSSAANYATSQNDRLAFYDDVVVPDLVMIAECVNKFFETLGLRLSFDWQSLSIYQEDENRRAEALNKYVASGFDLVDACEILGINLTAEQIKKYEQKAKQNIDQLIIQKPTALLEDSSMSQDEVVEGGLINNKNFFRLKL